MSGDVGARERGVLMQVSTHAEHLGLRVLSASSRGKGSRAFTTRVPIPRNALPYGATRMATELGVFAALEDITRAENTARQRASRIASAANSRELCPLVLDMKDRGEKGTLDAIRPRTSGYTRQTTRYDCPEGSRLARRCRQTRRELPMSKPFLCCKREDHRRVQRLDDALTRVGLSVWWDRGIPGAEAFRQRIEQELADARCVIVVWRRDFAGVNGAFVRDEVRALGRSARLAVPSHIRAVPSVTRTDAIGVGTDNGIGPVDGILAQFSTVWRDCWAIGQCGVYQPTLNRIARGEVLKR